MVVWQGGAIDVSAAEAAAGALAEAAAGSVLEANGEELVVARLRGLPWSFDAVKVRRRNLTQRWEPLGGVSLARIRRLLSLRASGKHFARQNP